MGALPNKHDKLICKDDVRFLVWDGVATFTKDETYTVTEINTTYNEIILLSNESFDVRFNRKSIKGSVINFDISFWTLQESRSLKLKSIIDE